ncbi:MAG TPA: flagellar hook-associated protein FlgL [Steroidobacteraceae bacterium]|jgi:flagellar hook-associated protein 3 FlgL|nr:flagellar hook-associated protein FlgL [Steroidobacteraceae bacterium]
MSLTSISTLTFQTNALDSIEALEKSLSTTQNELSTGVSLQDAADNPAAMVQVNQLNTALSASQQYSSNGNLVSTNLKLEEQALTNATNVLQSVQSLADEANNSSLTSAQRQDIGTQLSQQLQQLVSIANSTDGNGNYLFSGYATTTQPFAQNGDSVAYSGAEETSQVQIAPDQSVSTSDTGSSVFMNVAGGNGTFTTAAAAANTGTASIGPGTVTSPSEWQAASGTYTISFTSPTAYQVTDGAGTVVTQGTYDSTTGNTVSFNGIQVAISGDPATGDQFTVAPAGSSSAFATIQGLITTLNSTGLNSGQLATQISQSIEQLSSAVNNLNDVQASVGARINAVTTAQTTETSNQTTYQSQIANLSQTDYAAATTQLSSEEVALQAAEESYASLAKLSLFNYISG